MRFPMVRACAWIAVLAIPVGAQSKLWVVADTIGPGVDFDDMQDAIDAADDGDAILCHDGVYQGRLVIDGKALTVIGDGDVQVQGIFPPDGVGSLEIVNLAAGQTVVWQGIGVSTFSLGGTDQIALALRDNAGLVWLEDSAFAGAVEFANITVENSTDVVLTGCESTCWFGSGDDETLAAPALRVDAASRVRAYDSSFHGGGGSAQCTFLIAQADGGHGAHVFGELFASGCVFQGGDGADYDFCSPNENEVTDGGDGLRLEAGAYLETVDCTFIAGQGGQEPHCCGGANGVNLAHLGGVYVPRPGVSRSVTCTSPVREGEPSQLTFSGAPGDGVLGVYSFAPASFDVPTVIGPLFPALPANTVFLGIVPGGGAFGFPVSVSELGVGIDVLALYLQTLHATAGGDFYLSAPAALEIIDSAF